MGERDDRDIGRVAAASVPSPILRCFFKMFIWIGEGLLLGIVECAANWLYRELDRRFPDLIDVVEERDNVDGEGSENENGSNVAAEVMDNVNGEGNGNESNDKGVGETGEIRENTSTMEIEAGLLLCIPLEGLFRSCERQQWQSTCSFLYPDRFFSRVRNLKSQPFVTRDFLVIVTS